MNQLYVYVWVFSTKIQSGLFCTVYRAVLSSGASIGHTQMGKMPFYIFVYTLSDNGICMLEKESYCRLFCKEINDWCVFTCIGFVFRVSTRIGKGSAIEDMASPIPTAIFGKALLVTETNDGDGQSIVGGRIGRKA